MTTPTWSAPKNLTSANASASLDQLLGAHADTEIYDGIIGTQVQAGYGGPLSALGQQGWQELASGVQIDQPFVLAGANGIGRVELPLSALAGIGADVSVSLYADSGGVPAGGALFTLTFPKEFLTAACLTALSLTGTPAAHPRPNPAAITTWAPDYSASVPVPGAALINYGTTQAGNVVVFAGGADQSSNAYAQVFSSQFTGEELSPWQSAPALPVPTVNPELANTDGYLIVAGGLNTSTVLATVATAAISGSGTISAWTAQAALPAASVNGSILATSIASGDYVYNITGSSDGANPSASVYWAQMTSGGTITSWQTGPALPVALQGMSAVIVGRYLFVSGGITTFPGTPVRTTFYARINADGSLAGWIPGPTLPVGGFAFPSISVGGQIGVLYGVGGNAVYTVTVGPDGDIGPLVTQPLVTSGQLAAAFQTSATTYKLFALQQYNYEPRSATLATSIPALSIPVSIGGLTLGATYHFVFETSGGDVNHSAQLHVGADSAAPTANYKQGAGSWTAYPSGSAVPLTTYYGVGGRIAHQWLDSGARWNWFQWNQATGQPAALGEVTAQIRSMVALQYDPNGSLTTALSVA